MCESKAPRCPFCGDRGNIFVHLEHHDRLVCSACDRLICLDDVRADCADLNYLLAAVEKLLHHGRTPSEAGRNGRRIGA
jgi:hypothetical protein